MMSYRAFYLVSKVCAVGKQFVARKMLKLALFLMLTLREKKQGRFSLYSRTRPCAMYRGMSLLRFRYNTMHFSNSHEYGKNVAVKNVL